MDTQDNVIVDARPIWPVAEDSLWDEAARLLKSITSNINSELNRRNITALIRKSQPGQYPPYVLVDSWIKTDETEHSVYVDRSFLKIEILVNPCRIHQFTFKIELKSHGQEFRNEHWEIYDEELSELVDYLIKGGKKPKFFKPRVSYIERLFLAFIPFADDPLENKLIDEARPNFFTGLSVLGFLGAFIALMSLISINEEDNANVFLFFFLGIIAFIYAIVKSNKREIIETVPKQSLRTPRREFRIDSWHVSVPGAGEHFEDFKKRIYNIIKTKEPSIEMSIEQHQRLAPRGFEERERLVLIKGQSTLHVHVYPFANEAFVGWESYLNWNRWAETEPLSTTVRDGKKYNYRSIEVSPYIPTDFDIIEADVLAETTHRIIIEEIKVFLKEKEIEADLDFKIIRGDRANALKEGKEDKEKKKGWLM